VASYPGSFSWRKEPGDIWEGEAVCMHMRPSRNHNNCNRNHMNIDVAGVKQ